MFKYKNITLFVFVILISSLTSHLAYAFPFFEYEIWMQAETSLDIGQIEVQGAIVNMGSAPLDLTAQWGALGGLPSNLNETTPGLEYVHQQLNGNILNSGEQYNFLWLYGTQEQDLSNRAGELLSGSLGLIPYASDWRWTQGGFIPELLTHSEWVNGFANTNLPFNKILINLDVADQYIDYTFPASPVPEPSTAILFLLGFIPLLTRQISGLFPRLRRSESR